MDPETKAAPAPGGPAPSTAPGGLPAPGAHIGTPAAPRDWDRELADVRREAQALRKRLDEANATIKEHDISKLGELEQAHARAADFEAQLSTARADLTRRERDLRALRMAHRYALPDALAARLQGETDEEMEVDAKALAALLPKPVAPTPPPAPLGTNPARPGAPAAAPLSFANPPAWGDVLGQPKG